MLLLGMPFLTKDNLTFAKRGTNYVKFDRLDSSYQERVGRL